MTEPTEAKSGPMVEAGSSPTASSEVARLGTYCPRCGYDVPLTVDHCPGCSQRIYHHPSKVQRQGLLAGLGFIFLGGCFIFLQQGTDYHTFIQDALEIAVIFSVMGAGISFFIAVSDMVRRGGE